MSPLLSQSRDNCLRWPISFLVSQPTTFSSNTAKQKNENPISPIDSSLLTCGWRFPVREIPNFRSQNGPQSVVSRTSTSRPFTVPANDQMMDVGRGDAPQNQDTAWQLAESTPFSACPASINFEKAKRATRGYLSDTSEDVSRRYVVA